MSDDRRDDNQHFREVLSRLDALMKRNQDSADVPTALPPTEPAPAEPPASSPAETAISLAAHDVIPVLTEVYDGTAPLSSNVTQLLDELRQAQFAALQPQLDELIAHHLDTALAELRAALLPRLKRDIAALLQQPVATAAPPQE